MIWHLEVCLWFQCRAEFRLMGWTGLSPSMMDMCTALRRVRGTLLSRGPCVMDGQLLLGTRPALWPHTHTVLYQHLHLSYYSMSYNYRYQSVLLVMHAYMWRHQKNVTQCKQLYTLKNAGLFQPMFGSNMHNPNHWFKFLDSFFFKLNGWVCPFWPKHGMKQPGIFLECTVNTATHGHSCIPMYFWRFPFNFCTLLHYLFGYSSTEMKQKRFTKMCPVLPLLEKNVFVHNFSESTLIPIYFHIVTKNYIIITPNIWNIVLFVFTYKTKNYNII